jgi:hypothetical protein
VEVPNPKMTLALDIPALHEPSHVRFGSGRTSVHEVFLRDEPCSVRAWLSKLGGCTRVIMPQKR